MGIITTARLDFSSALEVFKASTIPTRAQKRRYVAALVTAGQEWLNKHDAADAAAPAEFAATKAGQFKAFTDGIADPVLDPVDPALDLPVP